MRLVKLGVALCPFMSYNELSTTNKGVSYEREKGSLLSKTRGGADGLD